MKSAHKNPVWIQVALSIHHLCVRLNRRHSSVPTHTSIFYKFLKLRGFFFKICSCECPILFDDGEKTSTFSGIKCSMKVYAKIVISFNILLQNVW